MQQWWFEAKISLFMTFLYDFPLSFKVVINIHEYKNKIICIFDHSMKVFQSLLPFIYLREEYDLAMVANALERKTKI